MGTRERREADKEVLRKKIIEAAKQILINEGYEKLSIRKIANSIEYSPGIIYHYFQDKSDIMKSIVEEGYNNMIMVLRAVPIDEERPDKAIVDSLKTYMYYMMEQPEQFRAVLLNDIGAIQDRVNMLDRGISKTRSSISQLCTTIQKGIEKGFFRDVDPELTAQILWTATHGLLSRLILEKDLEVEQKERLIEHHFEVLMNGIAKQN